MSQAWRILGNWYQKGSSERRSASLEPGPLGRLRFRLEGDPDVEEVLARELDISPRLGATPRYLTFPDGSVLETPDNEAVDTMLRLYCPSAFRGWVHRLESHWPLVVLTLVLVIGVVWGSIQYGVPALSRHLAHKLPAEALDQVSRETLVFLDKVYLESSQLDPARQQSLRSAFSRLLTLYPEGRYRILFRRGGDTLDANAMALPDGTLIFTDQLVELAANEEELLAILAHEVGHVELRHSLRAVIQNSLIGVGALLITGDAEVLAGLPVLFTSLSYSRDHEREADAFAAQLMRRQGLELQAFVSIMTRMQDWSDCRRLLEDDESALEPGDEAQWRSRCETLREKKVEQAGEDFGLSGYLSTHPATEERLRRFRR